MAMNFPSKKYSRYIGPARGNTTGFYGIRRNNEANPWVSKRWKNQAFKDDATWHIGSRVRRSGNGGNLFQNFKRNLKYGKFLKSFEGARKVGWTARTAMKGAAMRKQAEWRTNYYKRHGNVR
jgi:hypothetical protein